MPRARSRSILFASCRACRSVECSAKNRIVFGFRPTELDATERQLCTAPVRPTEAERPTFGPTGLRLDDQPQARRAAVRYLPAVFCRRVLFHGDGGQLGIGFKSFSG